MAPAQLHVCFRATHILSSLGKCFPKTVLCLQWANVLWVWNPALSTGTVWGKGWALLQPFEPQHLHRSGVCCLLSNLALAFLMRTFNMEQQKWPQVTRSCGHFKLLLSSPPPNWTSFWGSQTDWDGRVLLFFPKLRSTLKTQEESTKVSQGQQDSTKITVLTLAVFSTCTSACMHTYTGNSHLLSQPLQTKLNIRACSAGHLMPKPKFLCLPVSRCRSQLFQIDCLLERRQTTSHASLLHHPKQKPSGLFFSQNRLVWLFFPHRN